MAKVKCDIDYDTTDNDDGIPVPCVNCTCTRCGHETMSFGDSDASVRRCLALMREECPRGENNFYTDKGELRLVR